MCNRTLLNFKRVVQRWAAGFRSVSSKGLHCSLLRIYHPSLQGNCYDFDQSRLVNKCYVIEVYNTNVSCTLYQQNYLLLDRPTNTWIFTQTCGHKPSACLVQAFFSWCILTCRDVLSHNLHSISADLWWSMASVAGHILIPAPALEVLQQTWL